jgi:hypothetical protein
MCDILNALSLISTFLKDYRLVRCGAVYTNKTKHISDKSAASVFREEKNFQRPDNVQYERAASGGNQHENVHLRDTVTEFHFL